jgi:hypothetical protein
MNLLCYLKITKIRIICPSKMHIGQILVMVGYENTEEI